MFFASEDRKHEKVDAIPFPVYKGPGTKDDIKKYTDKTLMPWVQKKRAAIEEVDTEYQKVTELQPVPPPRWVIAAASRAGLMWGNFVDDFRKAPYPKDWDKKGFVPGTGDTLSLGRRASATTSSTSTRPRSRSSATRRSRRSSAASTTR